MPLLMTLPSGKLCISCRGYKHTCIKHKAGETTNCIFMKIKCLKYVLNYATTFNTNLMENNKV